ncbi:MAG: acylneuraminate cytidylyltransferase family protein [Muribaculaceae bacterium]|nr:acylneuraminate cytidylyltransferase family protein [Muribaculaceae bacterium]
MKPLFIIPARGGSKGIPGKNIRPFCGRPLLTLAIDGALACCDAPERILLSTDSEEIADVARRHGLPVPYMRPAALAADDTPTRDALLHAMDWADARGIDYDCVVLLQPTSPLRTPEDLRGAMSLYSPDADMVVSVTAADANPYYNLFEADADGYLHVCKGDGSFTRRQDAPPVWEYNGAVYVINPDSLRTTPMGQMHRVIPYPMPRHRSADLDTLSQWAAAEESYKNQHHI